MREIWTTNWKLQHDREIEKIKAEKKIELEKLEISERRVSGAVHDTHSIMQTWHMVMISDVNLNLVFELTMMPMCILDLLHFWLKEMDGITCSERNSLYQVLLVKQESCMLIWLVLIKKSYVSKTAILAKHEINSGSYRFNFRNTVERPMTRFQSGLMTLV